MYVARYNLGPVSIRQALVRVKTVVLEDADDAPWHDLLHQACRYLMGASTLDFAYRVSLAESRLERIFFLSSYAEGDEELVRLANAFLRLNELRRGSVEVCATRADHDALAGAAPVGQARISHRTFRSGTAGVVHDFRLFPLLDRLLPAARQAPWPLAYQVNVRRRPVDAGHLRAVRKNLAALALEQPLPPMLLEQQEALAARFGRAEFAVDELACFPHDAAARHVMETVRRDFTAGFRRLGFADSPMERTDDEDTRALVVTGLQSSLLDPAPALEAAAQAVPGEELTQWLCWEPPAAWMRGALDNLEFDEAAGALRGATIVNHGTLEISPHKTIDMATHHTTITLGAGVNFTGDIVVAGKIQDSFNKAAAASGPAELKEQLQALTKLMTEAIARMPPATAAQAAQDLQTIVNEATSPQPRKAWYELSAQGLLDAAKTVGELAGPIATAVKGILGLLG